MEHVVQTTTSVLSPRVPDPWTIVDPEQLSQPMALTADFSSGSKLPRLLPSDKGIGLASCGVRELGVWSTDKSKVPKPR